MSFDYVAELDAEVWVFNCRVLQCDVLFCDVLFCQLASCIVSCLERVERMDCLALEAELDFGGVGIDLFRLFD